MNILKTVVPKEYTGQNPREWYEWILDQAHASVSRQSLLENEMKNTHLQQAKNECLCKEQPLV